MRCMLTGVSRAFDDIMPEFHPQALDSLRQPLETGEVMVARANYHISYPAEVQLVAARNPCRAPAASSGTPTGL